MKNQFKIILFILSLSAILACTQEQKSDQAYEDYREYVNDHSNNAEKYYDRQWAEIEQEYNEKKNNAEAKMDNWNDQMRAEYKTMEQNWESFREKHTAELQRRDNEKSEAVLVTSLLPAGINEEFTNVTSANIVDVYRQFVDNVSGQKDNLTKEQWTRVEYLWEKLDDRKDQIEKEIKANDELALAEQKLKYTGIKAVNRPVAKTEEEAANDKNK